MGKTCPIHATFHCQMRPSCQTVMQSGLSAIGKQREQQMDKRAESAVSALGYKHAPCHQYYLRVLVENIIHDQLFPAKSYGHVFRQQL